MFIIIMKFKVHKEWHKFFIKNKEQLQEIIKSIDFKTKNILPPKDKIFRTFEYFSPKDCKLLLLGQDPYPGFEKKTGTYYAEGLSFSVNPNIKVLPGSLRNIFKELKDNYPNFEFENGSLLKWVENEKIMLLNSSLTVEEGKPNIHSKIWEDFTNKVIQELDENSKCLFLLMGGNAKKKIKLIKNKDRIVTCVHPSPLSAYQGFFGSKIFCKINDKLQNMNLGKINFGCNLL